MKRCIAGAALAFIVVSLCFAQAELPDAMKKSYIQLRPGVFDIGKITVEEAFLNKTFTVTELPDGSITTTGYGSLYSENGLYHLEILFYKNDKVRAMVTFHLLNQGETTFIHSVTAENYETGESSDSTNMPEKYQFLLLLDELSEKGE
ncbi:MAG TPA: hypothetical protein PLJ76_08845 [Treponemataceae bacterium]|nr:hypothetical protein [Treponemataceae bacterium]